MPEFNLFEPLTTVIIRYALWTIPIVVSLSAFRALLPRLKGAIGESMVGSTLKKLFGNVLHDIIVPDGRGGLTQIDHVALTGAGLLVVETKNYSGAIFGTARDAQWTQRLGGRSYRFQNPLRQNHLHVSALRALLPLMPVRGHVVFTGGSKFPKGIPEGVSFLSNLRQDLAGLATDAAIPPAHTTAWEQLKQNARTDKLARKEHLAAIHEKRGGGFRERMAGIMFALSAVWLVALWMWTGLPINTSPQPIAKRERLAPATAHFAPYPYPKQDIAKPMAREQRSAPVPAAEIAWSSRKSSQREECNLAIAAVLIENNAENRRQRDRACAGSR